MDKERGKIMRSKKSITFITLSRQVALILALVAVLIVVAMGSSSLCRAQSEANSSVAEVYDADASPYWYPDPWYWYWWYDPDLDVHIGKFYKLSTGVVFPVTVHNHWYGEASNVNLEVYAQKTWCACLNRPPSARLAEISFKSVPPGGSKTIWVWWDREPQGGCSLYAQVDSGNLFTPIAWGGAVSPYFRKNDHSTPGIRYTPDGNAVAYWPLAYPYGVAVDLVRNPNFICGQNYERNEKNNWDYFQRYDVIAQPGQPVLVPLPIINPVEGSTFSGTLSLVADSVDRQMLEAVALGRVATLPAAPLTTASAIQKAAFRPSPNNILDFALSYNQANPEAEFPAAVLITPGKTKGTSEFRILMTIDSPSSEASEDQQKAAVEINIFVDIK